MASFRVQLFIDGQPEDNIKDFQEDEFEISKAIHYMNKTDFGDVTPRYTFSVLWIPGKGGRDWTKIKEATVAVLMDDGGKINYSGVRTLKYGELSAAGDDEMGRRISLGAKKRSES